MEDIKSVFDDIYKNNKWGGKGLYSGEGSRNSDIVDPYVRAVRWFIGNFNRKPDAVDLGCGDFHVGSKIRPYCKNYTAIDLSESVVAQNSEKYAELGVSFRVLDARFEELPDGDVIFIRQVFQHLSNAVIKQILPKLLKFQFIVFTDHIPAYVAFAPNQDIATGQYTRLGQKSGVVLTAHPFLLRPISELLLCAIPAESGIIKTTVYQMF